MGAAVVLVERGLMGGDCLNFGCVPSKSLLAAARLADLEGTQPSPWRTLAPASLGVVVPRIGG
jgi:pyruvate/2-oxoglutarate dehydrogenase complex dihydrolipoamide dehydrogenase (E3) component